MDDLCNFFPFYFYMLGLFFYNKTFCLFKIFFLCWAKHLRNEPKCYNLGDFSGGVRGEGGKDVEPGICRIASSDPEFREDPGGGYPCRAVQQSAAGKQKRVITHSHLLLKGLDSGDNWRSCWAQDGRGGFATSSVFVKATYKF